LINSQRVNSTFHTSRPRPGVARSRHRGTARSRIASSLWLPLLLLGAIHILAQTPDQGIPELRQLDPTLTGSGIAVIQPEAIFTGDNDWEVYPPGNNQPAGKFTYISASGTANTYPNALGYSSDHAHYVGSNFYGDADTADPEGIAYGISHIYNYEADYFVNDIILPLASPLPAEIVNQSFNILVGSTNTQAQYDQAYDNFAVTYGTLFITGAGNGPLTGSPASAYNGIAVGAYQGTNVSGNYDGRSKPDIVAYSNPTIGDDTSYTAPFVSGAAAILLQAAQRGDAGSSPQTESDASDARVLKALLLNGATKPAGWKSTVADPTTTPLDPVTGAGILNMYNSYLNLAAGEHHFSATASGPVAPLASGPVDPAEGWDLDTLTNTLSGPASLDQSNHYDFDLSSATAPSFTLTATLIWWRQLNQSSINNLYLYLFDTDTDQTISASLSTIDNTQVLYVPDLAPGDYDLAVVKSSSNMVSLSDTYALAFNFAPAPEPSVISLTLPALTLLLLFRKSRPQSRSRK